VDLWVLQIILSNFFVCFRNRASQVIYGESSMRNGFGLRLVHKFLGLPFLRLQKISLLESLERNARDSNICSFEISEFLVLRVFFFSFLHLLIK
jgi:hypothetical protein